ncbi:putative DNA binding domain-containing protein [Candidatus Micrarchaeota archaeon]|nr:putative DNA binding domain-containing protein [Candidatus Micrarchaeota archaeon]
MKPEELTFLITQGEGLTVEFKERFTLKIDEDIIAFANTRGGFILLGVNDAREITGETLTNELKGRIISLARNCKPQLEAFVSQLENVVVVEVPEGTEKPHSCASGYFRRLDGATQKLSKLNSSASGIAQSLGISARAVEKHLSNLKKKGMLKRVGSDKGGHWEVAKK